MISWTNTAELGWRFDSLRLSSPEKHLFAVLTDKIVQKRKSDPDLLRHRQFPTNTRLNGRIA